MEEETTEDTTEDTTDEVAPVSKPPVLFFGMVLALVIVVVLVVFGSGPWQESQDNARFDRNLRHRIAERRWGNEDLKLQIEQEALRTKLIIAQGETAKADARAQVEVAKILKPIATPEPKATTAFPESQLQSNWVCGQEIDGNGNAFPLYCAR